MAGRVRSNRMGSYTVLRRLVGNSPPGRVYTAHHATTGRPALLVAVGEEPPAPGWQVLLETGAHPKPYVAMEVRRLPQGAVHPGRELTDLVDLAAEAAAAVEGLPEVQRHLERGASTWRRLWRTHARVRRPYVGALGAAVAVAVLALVTTPSAPRARAQLPESATAGVAEQAALEAPQALPMLTLDNRAPTLALDMPRKPFPGQYTPDPDTGKCKGRAETNIFGGCWVALKTLEPPCGSDAYEYKGTCYLPSAPSGRAPSTRAPRLPQPPAQRAP